MHTYVYCSYNEFQTLIFELWIFYSNLKITILIFKNILEFEIQYFNLKIVVSIVENLFEFQIFDLNMIFLFKFKKVYLI
jgi:hypothetical protein